MKPTGFIVFDYEEDWEQALALDKSEGTPPGGVLDWLKKGQAASVFPDRQSAKTAIKRTEHYRLAFASNHPEAKCCKIVPVIPA